MSDVLGDLEIAGTPIGCWFSMVMGVLTARSRHLLAVRWIWIPGPDRFVAGVGVEEDEGATVCRSYGWEKKLVRRKAIHGLRPQVIILAVPIACHWLVRP